MLQPNELEANYLYLREGTLSVSAFEQWVYQSKWLEKELSEEEYTALIALNYSAPSAMHEITKVLANRIGEGRLQTFKLLQLLDKVITRNGEEAEALMALCDLCGQGYHFLDDIGLGIGLLIQVPTRYGVGSYDALNNRQKKHLVNGAYPIARELAQALKDWLICGDLELVGQRSYVDNRSDADKKSRVWEVVEVDEETGEVRAKRNALLDKRGYFLQTKKSGNHWWRKVFSRK